MRDYAVFFLKNTPFGFPCASLKGKQICEKVLLREEHSRFHYEARVRCTPPGEILSIIQTRAGQA